MSCGGFPVKLGDGKGLLIREVQVEQFEWVIWRWMGYGLLVLEDRVVVGLEFLFKNSIFENVSFYDAVYQTFSLDSVF